MKFDTTAVIGLAFALAASASPVPVSDSLDHVEESSLAKRQNAPTCLNRGPKVIIQLSSSVNHC
jgi:hypothetical protein